MVYNRIYSSHSNVGGTGLKIRFQSLYVLLMVINLQYEIGNVIMSNISGFVYRTVWYVVLLFWRGVVCANTQVICAIVFNINVYYWLLTWQKFYVFTITEFLLLE